MTMVIGFYDNCHFWAVFTLSEKSILTNTWHDSDFDGSYGHANDNDDDDDDDDDDERFWKD